MNRLPRLEKRLRIYGILRAALVLALTAIVVVFCLFYLLHSHAQLVQWFDSLNACFYKNDTWGTAFFTPAIKEVGDKYCIVAILCVLGLLYFQVKGNKENSVSEQPPISSILFHLPTYVLSIASTIGLWLWGNGQAMPAYDEVFSAQNVAGILPLQGLSYYMLPNNHLLFNLLNNLFFHTMPDKVASGRIISLIAYCSVALIFYRTAYSFIHNRIFALATALIIAMQFFTWGFSFQARGYELYLLAGWGLIGSMFAWISSKRLTWLRVNTLCVVVGYFCMPSFLYLHAAQLVFMAFYSASHKNGVLAFWKYQLSGFVIAYLCYLPTLTFSGIDAIIHNPYVSPMTSHNTIASFSQWMFPYFNEYIAHMFSNILAGRIPLHLWLYFFPILLVFSKKGYLPRLAGLFYLCIWIVFFAMVIVMKRLPFERNMVIHYSFSLAVVLLSVYVALSYLPDFFQNILRNIFFGLGLIAFAFCFLITNPTMLRETLYEYNVNRSWQETQDLMQSIPAGSTASFSNESFYCRCVCQQKGCKTNSCPDGSEIYYVKKPFEILPAMLKEKYELVGPIGDYQLYKRK